MKILGKHILILGGFYFIISFLLDLGQGYFLIFWKRLLLVVLL